MYLSLFHIMSMQSEGGMISTIFFSVRFDIRELTSVTVSSQEPSVMTEDDNGSDNSQFTGSTINLQDLE